MVSHAGEIGIKSKTTRRFMIKKLYKNITTKFPDSHLEFKNIANRTIIFTENPKILAKEISEIIFGVSHTAPIYFFTWSSYDALLDTFIQYSRQFMKEGKSFGFESRTSGKNRPSSQSLKVELGSKLYEAFNGSIRVDLTHPDFLFTVEVRDEFAWIYHESFHGLDGYPQGAQKGIMFGNIRPWLPDYTASFLTMKRGVNVRLVRFHTEPENNPSNQEWHDQFVRKFIFLKSIDIPLYDLLETWQPRFGDNLCSACMFFSERLLTKASKLREAAGFISGVRSLPLEGDISAESLKWFENHSTILKIRPNIVSKHETIEQSSFFASFNQSNSCCPFQQKRLITSTLSSDEISMLEDKAEQLVHTYFSTRSQDSESSDTQMTEK